MFSVDNLRQLPALHHLLVHPHPYFLLKGGAVFRIVANNFCYDGTPAANVLVSSNYHCYHQKILSRTRRSNAQTIHICHVDILMLFLHLLYEWTIEC